MDGESWSFRWFLELLSYPCPIYKVVRHLIWHFLDVVVIQAWILYKKDSKALEKQEIPSLVIQNTESLMTQSRREVSKRGNLSISVDTAYITKKEKHPTGLIPNKSVRGDGFDQWTIFGETKGRCLYFYIFIALDSLKSNTLNAMLTYTSH